ncbi:uncharacterized protein LOC126734995 isoform X2 [Anthonomus grandis grandis]|nr:uncharacterized protein LOC126734995 isoform X2 [Anthonomus grandis grandis]
MENMRGTKEIVQQSQEQCSFNSMILNFPYSELAVISSFQIKDIRQCLPILLEISQIESFYANTKAVRYTLNFATSMISDFNNINDSDLLAGLLMLLDKLLRGLTECNITDDIYPNVKALIELLLCVSDLEIFSNYFASMCKPIILKLLTSKSYDFDEIDVLLAEILENFKNVQADKEVHYISDYILQTFPLESVAFNASAVWLLEDSTKILRNVQTKHIGDEAAVRLVIKNMYTIFMKVGSSVRFHSQVTKYQKIITKLKMNLMDLTPKLIVLCCTYNIGPDARLLLDLVLHDFLNRQGVMARDIELITSREINKFPNDIQSWPLKCSKTFFWICHMLYYNQRVVWSTKQIAIAIRRLIYTKIHRKAICVPVLKSVCYIFPLLLKGTPQQRVRKLLNLGADLLNFLSIFRPLLDKILSLSKSQLVWILSLAPPNIKIGCVRFWLSKCTENHLSDLQEAVISTHSEKYLITAALSAKNLNISNLKRLIGSIKNLNSQAVYNELPSLIVRHLDNPEAVKILVHTCSRGVPSNLNLAIKLYEHIKMSLILYQTEEILLTSCYYISNMLNFYKNDENLKMLVCSDIFWFRFPISKIQKGKEELVKAILKLLNTIVKNQPKRSCINEVVQLKFSNLLNKSEDIIEESLIFMQQLSKVRSPITLDGDDVLQILESLHDLADNPLFASMVYKSLIALLKLNFHIINCPLLAMLIEERCYYLEYKRRNRCEYVKLVLLWIKVMRLNPNKELCNLPQSYVLYSFITRAMELSKDTTQRYLKFLDTIYSDEKKNHNSNFLFPVKKSWRF